VIRINFALLGVLLACALALVTSQHKARNLFTELEKEQDIAKQIDVEWGQLQLEQSTWAMHSRVEKIASSTTVHSATELASRRKKIFPRERGGFVDGVLCCC